MTVEDHSAYMRNGYFWNSTMGGFTFDAFDKIKNKSALFDGMVNCFLVLNSLNQNMDELTNNESNDQQAFDFLSIITLQEHQENLTTATLWPMGSIFS